MAPASTTVNLQGNIMHATILNQAAVPYDSTAVANTHEWTAGFVAHWEKVIALNTQTVKTTLAEQQTLTNAALSSRSFDEFIDLQTQQFTAGVKKSFAYWQHVEEIATQTREDMTTVMASGWSRYLSILGSLSDMAAPTRESGPKLLDEAGKVLSSQSAEVEHGEPVAIVDSLGQVVSSGLPRDGLH